MFVTSHIEFSQTWDGKGIITLTTDDKDAVQRIYDQYKDGDRYEVEIKKPRKKKTNNANKYMWVLCDKIAARIHSTKMEVYRSAVRLVGPYTAVYVDKGEAEDELRALWHTHGTGWVSEVVDDTGDQHLVHLYAGSSSYDTKQMTRLIDEIVEWAKDMDIETLPPDELAAMTQQWGVEGKGD